MVLVEMMTVLELICALMVMAAEIMMMKMLAA